jgi:2'-5' RNA ligase
MFHDSTLHHRPFFALLPPPALARQVISAASWFQGADRPRRPDHLHVTMAILDDVATMTPSLVASLKRVGDAVAAAPFELNFDLAVGSGRSVVLRRRLKNRHVEALHDRIATALRAAGLAERADSRFAPHMTLGYRSGAPFTQDIAPIGWTASEFVLVQSHLGKTRHEILGRWALAGGEDAQLTLF